MGGINIDINKRKLKENARPAKLYNLDTDLNQTKNFYKDKPEIIKEMEAILETYIPKEKRKLRR